jgi:hypothetical protein
VAAVVDEVFVDLVGERDQVALAAKPRQRLELLLVENAPSRVVGAS